MSHLPFYEYFTKEKIVTVEMKSDYHPNKGDIVNYNNKKYIVMGKEYTIYPNGTYGMCVLLKEQTTGLQPL